MEMTKMKTKSTLRLAPYLLVFFLNAAAIGAQEVKVTGVKVFHRNGQTFVTWKDVAEGEEGAAYRYSIYRSDRPITQENLCDADAVIKGILNNSCKLPGTAYTLKDRLDPTFGGDWKRISSTVTENQATLRLRGPDDTCLPMWTGVGVHTVQKNGRGYYAVVATDTGLKPLTKVVPGESATTEPVEETVAPVQPVRQFSAKDRAVLVEKTPKGLPLSIRLHASCGSKRWMPRGDCFAYFGPRKEMGWRAGQPGTFGLSMSGGERPCLSLGPRDTMALPAGKYGVENLWFGLYCRPNWSEAPEPRAYPFAVQRVTWIVNWMISTYGVDPNRITIGGQSMGAYGSLNIGMLHPHLFAAVYPTGPKCRMTKLPGFNEDGKKTLIYTQGPTSEKKLSARGLRSPDGKPPLMPDGKTEYFDHLNIVAFVERSHTDLPFLCFIGGRSNGKLWGGVDPWGDAVPMVKALLKSRHGFGFGWDNGGHGSAKKQFRKLYEYYPRHRFALNLSYPAFSNSSMDDLIDLLEGPKEGYINLGFVWTDPVDEADTWESALSNGEATDDITVDVTPRRCQKFKVKPGETFEWTASSGGTGKVTADEWGLVTIENVVIQKGGKTTLTIQRKSK